LTAPEITCERVAQVRALLEQEDLSGVLVRSTDRYLNEYVPKDESTRLWLTGFTGSMGDALIGRERAWLCVDGRYYLQADRELEGTPIDVERVPLGKAVKTRLFQLARELGGRIGYEPDRFTAAELDDLRKQLEGSAIELVPTLPSLIERVRGEIDEPLQPVRGVSAEAVGGSVLDKLALTRPALADKDVGAFVVQRLDELAWLSNLRGNEMPFQATFRGLGVLSPQRLVVGTQAERVPAEARQEGLELVEADAWREALPTTGRVGYDPSGATAHVVDAIRAAGAEPVAMTSPVESLKAVKNDAELDAMRRAFDRADGVVEAAVEFIQDRLAQGVPTTEQHLADEVLRLFKASGAVGLSFRVIAAFGENGAHIHYAAPDPERLLEPGQLVLLDTGGYYEEGYATDLTRTFLAGRDATPTGEQRRLWTLVLSCSINGMMARLPVTARGEQLDAIVRAPLWAEGLDYNHGTGHGVGINVHEAPPRVSTRGKPTLKPGQVFSIEPGYYLPGWGGIRIENLCTIEPCPEAEGFLDVVPLTFAGLDERLVDRELLTPRQRAWLDAYLVESVNRRRARG